MGKAQRTENCVGRTSCSGGTLFLQGIEELGAARFFLRTGLALAYTIESQSRTPQYCLQLLCVMS